MRKLVIPILIVLGLVAGLAIGRVRFLVVAFFALALSWALLVLADTGADFLGGLAFGAANAAVGLVAGAGIRRFVQLSGRHLPGS